MMYLCIVMEVIQNRIPERTIVMIPGTHPSTLQAVSVTILSICWIIIPYESDHDWAMIARQT